MRLAHRSIAGLPLVLLSASLLAGCGGDGSGPVTAASMTAPGGASVTGTVGQGLLIEVVVTGSNGKPFAGGMVSFSVTSGGGSASPSQANTDRDGKASTTWALGTTSGTQTLTASLEGASLQFSATAQAGLPESMEAMSTYSGRFLPGIPLLQPATFLVRDQYNNPVPGVSVSFQATDGGSANPAQTTTGSDGRATTSWTLGPWNGIQTLSASVSALTPATVTAEAYDPCLDIRAYAIGQSAVGVLTTASCEIEFDNEVRFADLYQFTLASPGAFRFTVTSSFLNPYFLLFDPGAVAGETATFGTALTVKAFLDDGGSTKKYYPWIASDAGGVGSYTLTSGSTPGAMQNCETWVSTRTLSTNQAVSPEDCLWSYEGDTHYSDLLTIWLNVGETLVVTQSSTFFDTMLWLLKEEAGGGYTILALNDDYGGTSNSRLQYTAPESGFFHIAPTTFFPGAFGAYNMTISSSGGSSPPATLATRGELAPEFLPLPTRAAPGNRILRSMVPRPVKRR